MDDEKLIEYVRQHVELYDLSHFKYMDGNHKEKIWTLIGKCLMQPELSPSLNYDQNYISFLLKYFNIVLGHVIYVLYLIQIFQQCSIILNFFSVAACKTRWSNIRDNFRKSLKRRVTKSGQAASKIIKYKFEEELQFLLPYLKERETISNVIDEENETEDEELLRKEEFFENNNNQQSTSRQQSDDSEVSSNVANQKPVNSQFIQQILFLQALLQL
ncbi:uncharacterized protein [Temnothorax longispinosus]|uniref:uncharacterized protein n=1 Tax=Temnothorax longispinosus TaxID=300112 RepID=UPI003A98D3A5